MAAREEDPRHDDEWRVEVKLEGEEHGLSLGERLRALDLDDEARERLGHSVIVTRDGPQLYMYAWHQLSAVEAEGVVRDLLAEEGLAGEVQLTRWHPAEEAWRPADEPLPATEEEVEAERRRHEVAERREHGSADDYEWQVVVHLPSLGATLDLARRLEKRNIPVKRRWRYVIAGAPTEDAAIELGEELQGEVPEGSAVGIRANPADLPTPVFVQLGSLKPGVMRDLGL